MSWKDIVSFFSTLTLNRLLPAIVILAVGIVLVRLLLMPMKLVFKIGIHSGCGFLCLWLLNSVAAFTGAYFPINAVTVLVAGFLGLPGIGVMALLEVLSM